MKKISILIAFFCFIEIMKITSFAHRFYALTNEDGITRNTISCIIQDSTGYMWFGTQNGLNRWDGSEIEVFYHEPDDPHSLAGNTVNGFLMDRHGHLIIVLENGLSKYDKINGRFDNYFIKYENNLIDNIETVVVDRENRYWVGTLYDGVFLCDSLFNVRRSFRTENSDLSNNHVHKLFYDDDNRIWIGNRSLVDRYDPGKDEFKRYRFYHEGVLIENQLPVKTMFQDSENRIYFGTWREGVYYYDEKNDTLMELENLLKPGERPRDKQIESIIEDKNGKIWIGTWNGGLHVFDKKKGTIERYARSKLNPYSINSNSIWSLYADNQDNIWIGTVGGGVNRCFLNSKPFEVFRSMPGEKVVLSENHALSISCGEDNILWIGATSKGLNKVEMNTGNVEYINMENTGLSSDKIYSARQDKKNGSQLWIGTNQGLNKFDMKNKENKVIELNDTRTSRDNLIYEILQDDQGVLWLATANGLWTYDPVAGKKKRFIDTKDEISKTTSNIWDMWLAKNGRLWLGTPRGLFLFDMKKGTSMELDYENIEMIKEVTSIYGLGDTALIVGSWSGAFIVNEKKEKINKINNEKHLKNAMVLSVLEDDQGDIWLGTNKGLYRYDPESRAVVMFNEKDGLPGNEFESNACCKKSDGKLFFGGPEGVVGFYPEKIELDRFQCPVVLTGFELFERTYSQKDKIKSMGKEINYKESVRLKYKENSFVISFSALSYHLASENVFKYRLAGFDSTWKNSEKNNRSATFTNIDHGEYVFQVKAANHDEVWNEKPKSLKIIIEPPFWATWWFRLIVVLFLMAVAIIVHKIRTFQIRKKNLLLKLHNRELNGEIRERIKAEKALKESEYRYRLLFQKSSDPVILFSRDEMTIRKYNGMALELYQYNDEELKNMKFTDLFEKLNAKEFMDSFNDNLNRVVFTKHRKKDGRSITVSINTSILRISGETMGMSVIRDETERLRKEEEVKRLRNYLKNIIDSMPSILVGLDAGGRVTQWNVRAEKETGLPEKDVLGKELKKVFPRLMNDIKEIKKTIKDKNHYVNHKIIKESEEKVRYEDVTIYPLISNGVQGVVLKVDDITDRIKLEEMLVQSEKMMSLGGLAAGMAHEINNPLTTILQSCELIYLRLDDKIAVNRKKAMDQGLDFHEIIDYLKERNILKLIDNIIISSKRANKIVNNMLAFSRKSHSNFVYRSIGRIIEDTVELARNDYGLKKKYHWDHVNLYFEIENDIPEILCEPSELEQVFFNLLKNSAQAMTQAGISNPQITIKTKHDENHVFVSVYDNGPGIPMENYGNIFEPFFTTKERGIGTGLGLFVSYFIITKNHGGRIKLDDSYKQGAKFDIILPIKK